MRSRRGSVTCCFPSHPHCPSVLSHSFTPSLIHPLLLSFIHSLLHSYNHSFIHSSSFNHSLFQLYSEVLSQHSGLMLELDEAVRHNEHFEKTINESVLFRVPLCISLCASPCASVYLSVCLCIPLCFSVCSLVCLCAPL